MKIKTVGIALAAGLLLSAVPAAFAQDQPISIATKSGTIGTPTPGKAQIVFFRPGSLMGAALGCTVHEGEAEVARLGSGKYYVLTAEPGKHEFFTEGEAKDRLALEVEGDETYFVKCKIGMGIMAGRANISPSDQATFAQKAKGLAIWQPHQSN